MLEAVCRTLCMDFFADTFTPTGPADPDLETALQYLRRLALNSTGEAQPYEEYLRHLGYCMKGRYFFTAKQGHIGLLPEAGKRGDQTGFVDQETGEHIFEDPRLGGLPPGWRLEDPEARADWYNWFINDETGERPRWPMDPRMTAEALRHRRVPLQEFFLE
ncbi:MAG: hypothetical protein Q9221_009149 [Calogaya cf. arnoldii]